MQEHSVGVSDSIENTHILLSAYPKLKEATLNVLTMWHAELAPESLEQIDSTQHFRSNLWYEIYDERFDLYINVQHAHNAISFIVDFLRR